MIGKNVRVLRESQGYSQELLAKEAGLKRSYIGHIERGDRNLTVTNLHQIARALKVHPSVLLIQNGLQWDG